MQRRATDEQAVSETEIRITWRQWPDGRWEASVADETGRRPHRIRNQAELERFLTQAYNRTLGIHYRELDARGD
jgi:hypothetical protein